jgi:hypothetical protein
MSKFYEGQEVEIKTFVRPKLTIHQDGRETVQMIDWRKAKIVCCAKPRARGGEEWWIVKFADDGTSAVFDVELIRASVDNFDPTERNPG